MPQRLKPRETSFLAARLKPCPFKTPEVGPFQDTEAVPFQNRFMRPALVGDLHQHLAHGSLAEPRKRGFYVGKGKYAIHYGALA